MQLILLLLICTTSYSLERSTKTQRSYAFYYPLVMGSKEPAHVCLEVNRYLLPATVKVTFSNKTCGRTICKPRDVYLEYSCWEIIAPEQVENNYQGTQIKVEIKARHKGIKIQGQNQVQIQPNQGTVFIETDRRVYKMGDIVKLRVLVLDFDLKPAINYKIASIVIKSPYPTNAVVKEWNNVTVKSGLTHFEFQLAPDAVEGTWSINSDAYAYFEVRKYIPPRFQTSITGSDDIYNGSKSTSFSVCATFSYGRNVKGVALLTAKPSYYYNSQKPPTYSKVKKLNAGCAVFEIHPNDIGLNNNNSTVWSIELTAAVTEDGTDQTESTNKYVYISRDPYWYQWDYNEQYIKFGLPYKSIFTLTELRIPLKTRLVQLCYKFSGSNSTINCGKFTMDSNNSTEFTIPPIKQLSEPKNIQVEAAVLDHPTLYPATYYLTLWTSSSRNAIKIIKPTPDPVKCQSTLVFTVLYTSKDLKRGKEVKFKYILSSRSEIITTGLVRDRPRKTVLNLRKYPNVIGLDDYERERSKNLVDEFKLTIKLDKKIYKNSKLVVYHDLNNEIIADVADVLINTCSPNKVDAEWQKTTLYPGEVGKLDIKTDPDSLCSVTSVDKASRFLGSSVEITVDSVVNRIDRYSYIYQENCIKPNNTKTTPTTTLSSNYYLPWYGSSFVDSMGAFSDSRVGVISNKKFITRPCIEYPRYPKFTAVDNAAAGPANDDNRGSAIRSLFPETWLWNLAIVRKNGRITLEEKLPDSITDWVGNVLCVSPKKGFGISDDIQIKGFKPFFVDLLLPYSIKRNKEVLQLPVPVFNYLNQTIQVHIALTLNNGLVLIDKGGAKNVSICLEAGDSHTHNYFIKATKLGLLNITVNATAGLSKNHDCTSPFISEYRDVVRKPILVEPEGYPSGFVKSALLCANDSAGVNKIDWKINLPKHVVADTVNGKIIINSDILGPLFQNLENILVLPTGCGEQTMATLTPNLYVLKYLKANNALTKKIEEKILNYLQIGYQRMLNYMHEDGSFSAFGRSDTNGSMFLTSFVIRTFKQMKDYIVIDNNVVNKAIRWIISHQLENGCFDPVQHVFHEMGLSSSENHTAALTSYVLISFLETKTKVNDTVLSNAKKCILSAKNTDKYLLAISSYAFGLMNATEDAKNRLDKLLEIADHKDGMVWWTESETTLSTNVEVTGYVVKSLLLQSSVANLGTVNSIVRWLQSQMNPNGGFYSTQDTVVGLDAISTYALLINKKEPKVKVFVKTKTDSKTFEITKRDSSKPEIVPLTIYPNEVKANIQGDGCVSIQASVTYYLDTPITSKDLKLEISLKPVTEKSKCSFVELKPCASYTAPGTINMAIVEVSLPSGYAADQTSLYELTDDRNSGVKKFEQRRNQVIFYLIQLGSKQVCMPFKIAQNIIVENIANGTVKLYDYYKPEIYIYKSFKVEDC